MSSIALFSFIWGAMIGLFMAVRHFMGKKSGKAVGMAHGVFTLSGIAFLATGLVMTEAGVGWWILVSFLVTAAGGAYLFSRQVRDEPWPALAIVAHGGLAIASIVVLGLWLYGVEPGVGEGRDADVPAQSPENPTIPPDEITD